MKKFLFVSLAISLTLSAVSAMAQEHPPMMNDGHNQPLMQNHQGSDMPMDRPMDYNGQFHKGDNHPSTLSLIIDNVVKEVLF